jgi:putative ABC transport system permease protein
MQGPWLDVRHAIRLVRRQPGFSAFAVLTLMTGIGAATAVYSLVHAVLLWDFPFVEPQRLAWMYNARTERDRAPFSIADIEDYRRDNSTLAGMAVFVNWTANLTGGGEPERLEGTRVSGDFFPLLGSHAALGRVLGPRDEANGERVVVLTHGLWMRRFGGDSSIVGTRVVLNGAAYLIVGVMPPGFVFPFRDAELAVPITLRDDPRRTDRGANFLRIVARLKPGVTFAQAKADLDATAHRLQRSYPDDDARKTGVNLYPLHAEIVGEYRQILWTLFAAVGVLLAIGCGNLANVLLVRAVDRRSELGVRLALGASPRKIVVQLATEVMVLAVLGGALGLVVAAGAIAGWRSFGPANFPRLADIAIDGHLFLFAAAICAAVVLVCGVIPGWLATRDLKGAIESAPWTRTGGRREGFVRRAFVVVQIGGATVLLVCMGLAARSFARLEQVDPGFTPDHALSIQLSLPPTRYGNREAIAALYHALRARLDTVSSVRAVGAVSLLPLSGLLSTIDIAFPDRPAPPPDEVPQAHFRVASPDYFAAAGIAVIDGREFSDHDDARGKPVALVSRAFAERHWPGQRALGRYVQIPQGPQSPLLEIVGVVKDVKQFTVDGAATADLYVPIVQMPVSQAPIVAARMYWIVRTRADPGLSILDVRRAVRAVDPDIAASSVRTLDQVLSASLGSRRANVRLLEVFGQVALVLAAVGVYAIAASSAGARRRELAIRSAFGASSNDLVRLMLLAEMPPVLFGVAGGLLVALLVARSLGGLLFSVGPTDGVTYVAVALALLALAFVATWIPAARAGRTDPAELLRT